MLACCSTPTEGYFNIYNLLAHIVKHIIRTEVLIKGTKAALFLIPDMEKGENIGCGTARCFARIAPSKFLDRVVCMTTIRVKENEPFEVAMRRFKRSVEKTGLLTELRAREFYEKPTAERKRKLAAAVKRHYKRLRSQTLPPKLF